MAYNENLTVSGSYNLNKNNNELRDYSIYNNQYYSGCDVSIYFGDTWVDEIVSIQFQMQEKAMPLYGYADYVYSHLARGNRVVVGKFAINFVEAGYLQSILKRLSTNKLSNIPDAIARENMLITKQNVEQGNFEQFADYYEKAIWGEKDVETTKFARNDNSPRLGAQSFDIVIGYGAMPSGSSSGIVQVNGYSNPASTTQIIKNITLTGKSHVIDTSDNILMEEYEFIAQDIL